MKRSFFLILICATVLIMPVLAQAQSAGMSVSCDDGTTFDNGVEVIVNQMRSGFTYTATAIGLNGFDPVLAVLDSSTGEGLCSDDETSASDYSADLPTTGFVSSSSLSSQVSFAQTSGNAFADVSLVVGGYGNVSAEFLLILEGMAATDEDGTGDTFDVNITPGMAASGVPLSIYMITRGQSGVDPLLYLGDANLDVVSDNGVDVYCDDAGDSGLCYSPMDLSASTISIATGTLPTWSQDSVLSLDVLGMNLDSDRTQNYLTFVMTSYEHATEGQYLLAFHVGTTDDAGSSGLSGGEQTSSQSQQQTQTQTGLNANASGVSVACDDGSTFDNGIEILLIDMQSSVNYTATAIGLDGFDPVLAVLDPDTGDGLCNDDSADAADYAADLPTSGSVSAASTSSRIEFTQSSGSEFADISLIVGGYGNASGEFLVILEGMTATEDDLGGDVVNVNITPGMVNAGDPVTVYMIAETQALDAYILGVDSDLNPVFVGNGDEVSCDDAGDDDLCWGDSSDLSDSSVTLAGEVLNGWRLDAMLSDPLDAVTIDEDRNQNYFGYMMGASPSTEDATEGDYVLVFHIAQAG